MTSRSYIMRRYDERPPLHVSLYACSSRIDGSLSTAPSPTNIRWVKFALVSNGPGVYSGGESGSPLILMRALCTNPNLHRRWQAVRYELHFVEKEPARAAMLQGKLREFETAMRDGPGWTDRVRWSVTCGRYEENVPQLVAGNSALFLFLDPFGYSHAPMTLTQDLIQQPKSDTLIFLPLSFVNRFAGREGQEQALDRFFGSPAWRGVPDGPGRPAALLELFQRQLRAAGLEWVLPFRLKPEERGNTYWVVGGSGHLAGFASIKEGFWAADPVNGQGFAAPQSTPAGQEALAFEEPAPPGRTPRRFSRRSATDLGERSSPWRMQSRSQDAAGSWTATSSG